MDKYLSIVEDGTHSQKIATSLTMVKAYLQRLKKNNVYDNSVIIIMADHEHKATRPIRFIKGINEKHSLIELNRPVSYFDLQNVFCDLIDGKQSTELWRLVEEEQ